MNLIKKKLMEKKVVLGNWLSIPSTDFAEIVSASEWDFFVIDMEHGQNDFRIAQDMLRILQANQKAGLIRIQKNSSDLALKALDTGSDGVHVPHISSAEDARNAVDAAKYYPLGSRGLSPFTRAGKYGLLKEHTKNSNDNTLIVLHVEGKKGLENIEDIAQVKGIDVLFLGPYDLSQSLGKPGKVDDPDVISAIKKCVEAAKRNGIACGSFAKSKEYLKILLDCGVQYITYMVDSAVILSGYDSIYREFKGIYEK